MASVGRAELPTVPAGPGDTGVGGSGVTARRIALCRYKAPQGQAGRVPEPGRGVCSRV